MNNKRFLVSDKYIATGVALLEDIDSFHKPECPSFRTTSELKRAIKKLGIHETLPDGDQTFYRLADAPMKSHRVYIADCEC